MPETAKTRPLQVRDYVDYRPQILTPDGLKATPVRYDVIEHVDPEEGRGSLPAVFVPPSDLHEDLVRADWDRCSVDGASVTRAELRTWAETILRTLATT